MSSEWSRLAAKGPTDRHYPTIYSISCLKRSADLGLQSRPPAPSCRRRVRRGRATDDPEQRIVIVTLPVKVLRRNDVLKR